MAVVAIILGMLVGFGVVTAAPADAVECGDPGTFELTRLLVEFGGTDDGTLDGTAYLDTDDDVWCYANNDIIFTGHTPELHISCSEDLTGITVEGPGVPGGSAVITEFWLDSRNPANDKADRELCQDESTFPDPDPEPSATLACEEVESGQFSISYTLDKDGSTDQFDLTGPSGVTNLAEASTSTEVVSDADDGAYAITGTDADLTVPDDCDTLPPPDPEPAISLVKSPVVGEGSDLLDEDPNPLLQFSDSDSDEDAQTALYSYLITNTGDEPLINLSLEDTRIAEADLDLSACPEVLEVGDSCTATGSEDFTLADAEADEDGLVTNTGTVKGTGQESEQEVTASDDATIALSIVFPQAPLEKEDPKPAPDVKSDAQEQPAPEVESAAEELPATGLDREGLLPLSLLLMAIGGALLWLDRPWVGVR